MNFCFQTMKLDQVIPLLGLFLLGFFTVSMTLLYYQIPTFGSMFNYENRNIFKADQATKYQPIDLEGLQTKYSKDKVYCMIPTIIKQYKLWGAIADTYGKYCDTLKFFIDPLTFNEEEEYIFNKRNYALLQVLKFKKYPQTKGQKDNIEFEFRTVNGAKGIVVIVPMIRRKPYFNMESPNPRELEHVIDQYGDMHSFKTDFLNKYKPIGMCVDKKPCRHIWEKVWRSFVYIKQHDILFSHWFLKIDDDTFFLPSNLKKYIARNYLDYNQPLYFGHQAATENSRGLNEQAKYFRFVSGVCSVFSRESINMMTSTYQKMKHEYGDRSNFPKSHGICVDRDGATEERVTAKCLLNSGIEAQLAAELIQDRFERIDAGQKESYYHFFVPSSELKGKGFEAFDKAVVNQKRSEFYSILKAEVHNTNLEELGKPIFMNIGERAAEKVQDLNSLKAELVLPLGLPFTLTYKRKKSSTSWYWKDKAQDRGDLLNCCSYHAYAIHGYKSSSRMREFGSLLFDTSFEDLLAKLHKSPPGSEEWWYQYYILQLKHHL